MKYVDGYLLPVPKKSLSAYKRLAQKASKTWKKYGALDYKECIGDDLNTKWGIPFPKSFKLKKGEIMVFSYIVFKSKIHRNAVNAKVMKEMMSDPAMTEKQMPFDMKRMSYGGFSVIVDY